MRVAEVDVAPSVDDADDGLAGPVRGIEPALAEAGATVIVPARTPEKARASIADIPRVELEELDLIDSTSIDVFAQRFLGSGRPLDILINNAGIMAPPLERDATTA